MGLDMYLSAKRYVSKYSDEELHAKVNDSLAALRGPLEINTVVAEAMYWRKANAIHNWFVTKCRDGKDECQEVCVDRAQLVELRDTCKKVLEDQSLADILLPPAVGFFFGSTDLDDWYFDTLKNTVERLDLLLSDQFKDWDFYYQSSW